MDYSNDNFWIGCFLLLLNITFLRLKGNISFDKDAFINNVTFLGFWKGRISYLFRNFSEHSEV